MKILTISAFFPPYTYGGYEIRVGDIIDELSRRGHEIRVLTTKPDRALKAAANSFPYAVIRRLHGPGRKMSFLDRLTTHKLTRWLGISLVFLRKIWYDIQDTALFDAQINTFRPDLIYLGHIMPLSRALIPYLAKQTVPIVADEGGKGLIYTWEDRGLWQRFVAEFPESPALLAGIKKLFIWAVERVSKGRVGTIWAFPQAIRAFFNSNLNKGNAEAAGVPLKEARVIHSGIDANFFAFERVKEFGSPLTILVPGRIEEQKRQLDAVRLGALLKTKDIPFEMVIIGEPWNKAYTEQVETEIRAASLEKEVRILPMAGRAELVRLYHWADITLFLSAYQSGFSRVPLEAMACGSLVISYGFEGSDEIIRSDENGLLIAIGNLENAVTELGRLINKEQLTKQLLLNARTNVETKHSMDFYITQIEGFLLQSITNY